MSRVPWELVGAPLTSPDSATDFVSVFLAASSGVSFGFPSVEAAGFTSVEASGFPSVEASGFPSDEAAGFPSDEAAGFTSDEAAGFTSDEAAGFTSDEASGFTSDEASGFTSDSGFATIFGFFSCNDSPALAGSGLVVTVLRDGASVGF